MDIYGHYGALNSTALPHLKYELAWNKERSSIFPLNFLLPFIAQLSLQIPVSNRAHILSFIENIKRSYSSSKVEHCKDRHQKMHAVHGGPVKPFHLAAYQFIW